MLARKTPLRRTGPLKRTRMQRKSARRIDRETPREKAYKAWIHAQGCQAGDHYGPHEGPIQQAHERDHTGLGLKEDNFRSAALCMGHHDQMDGRRRNGILGQLVIEARRWLLSQWVREANEAFEASR